MSQLVNDNEQNYNIIIKPNELQMFHLTNPSLQPHETRIEDNKNALKTQLLLLRTGRYWEGVISYWLLTDYQMRWWIAVEFSADWNSFSFHICKQI